MKYKYKLKQHEKKSLQQIKRHANNDMIMNRNLTFDLNTMQLLKSIKYFKFIFVQMTTTFNDEIEIQIVKHDLISILTNDIDNGIDKTFTCKCDFDNYTMNIT